MKISEEDKRKKYEGRANECLAFANQTTNKKTREHFVALAETWAKLAKDMAINTSQMKGS